MQHDTTHFWINPLASYDLEYVRFACSNETLSNFRKHTPAQADYFPYNTTCESCKQTQAYKEAVILLEIGFDGNRHEYVESIYRLQLHINKYE